ncbi:MAG: heparinase II/III family protein [Geminicoccaceae bacterium]|jgi:hypothetical protein|nr:heparinase II/III family protein [Geminicoccaceae bacterium]HRY23020.1 heparinase II/III family protein [Geminicoccaceae bacterium]
MPARLHPYLFLTPGRLDRIRQGLDASGSGHDPTVQKWVDKMRRRAREIILPKPILTPDWIAAGEGATAPVMLYTARAAVSRITILGLLWHIDKDGGEADRNGSGLEAQEWLARACRELLAIASFPDWQKPSLPPEVFLSVAEMCAAAAIGLDWLWQHLNVDERRRVQDAIVRNALQPALEQYTIGRATNRGWTTEPYNWNIVCNTGMVLGALMVRDRDPALAEEVMTTALRSVQTGFAGYWNDGGWPEGPGYWSYATRYAAKLLDALRGLDIDDRDLSCRDGLERSGEFVLHCLGPTGMTFNFADSEPRVSLMAMSWLGERFGRDTDSWIASHNPNGSRLALQLLWRAGPGAPPESGRTPRDAAFASIHGAFFRSAWNDPDALWVGFKGGDARWHHPQLDAGTFVLDAHGLRWAVDLGPSLYANPGYFIRETRSRYYRASTQGHNTLRIGPHQQNDEAVAPLLASWCKDHDDLAGAIVDLSTAYNLPAGELLRGVFLLERRQVLIQDDFRNPPGAEVVWSMHTPATVTIDPERPGVAVLSQERTNEAAPDGTPETCYLSLRILAPQGAGFSQKSASYAGGTEYPEASINQGITKLQIVLPFDRDAPLERIAVLITPEMAPGKAPSLRPLDDWQGDWQAEPQPQRHWQDDVALHVLEGVERRRNGRGL